MTDSEWKPVPAYEGNDMASHAMERGFKLQDGYFSTIKSITNVGSKAIIITDNSIWILEPCREIGFSVKLLNHLVW